MPVIIYGKAVDMELDTGASAIIIPKSVWIDVLASKPVECTDIKLCSYSGQQFSVIGGSNCVSWPKNSTTGYYWK